MKAFTDKMNAAFLDTEKARRKLAASRATLVIVWINEGCRRSDADRIIVLLPAIDLEAPNQATANGPNLGSAPHLGCSRSQV